MQMTLNRRSGRIEHKARRQDVLVDEHQLFAFYDAKYLLIFSSCDF